MATPQLEGAGLENPAPKTSVFSRDTLIPVGLVMTLIGASVSFGIMYQRVNTLEDQIGQVRSSINSITSVRDDTILLKEQLRQIGVVVQEVREDVKDLKDRR